MDEFDEDERTKAYDRAVFIEFANIVQNYDETGFAEHDDIPYIPMDFDGSEYDFDGEPVTLYGLIIINLGESPPEPFYDYEDDCFDYLYDRLRGLRKPRRGEQNDVGYPDSPHPDQDGLEP